MLVLFICAFAIQQFPTWQWKIYDGSTFHHFKAAYENWKGTLYRFCAGDDDFICYYPMISSIPDVLGI